MLKRWCAIIGISAILAGAYYIHAAEFVCTNGEIINGEPISFKEEGVVFRKDSGGYTDLIQWPRFTQDSLKSLVKYPDPMAKLFGEVFIEVPLDLKAKEVKPPPKIIVNEVEKLNYYHPDPGFVSAWITPAGLFILGMLYLGNLVAAFSVARFRRKQPALVCGVSAVLPVIGPVIFLTQPESEEEIEEPETVIEETPAPAQSEVKKPEEGIGGDMASKLMTRVATVKDSKAIGYQPAVYTKGQITFNKRFFETKFPTFFRPVLGEKEKSVMFVITTVDGKQIEGIRYSRVTVSDIYLVPMNDEGETPITISQIESVEVKPRA